MALLTKGSVIGTPICSSSQVTASPRPESNFSILVGGVMEHLDSLYAATTRVRTVFDPVIRPTIPGIAEGLNKSTATALSEFESFIDQLNEKLAGIINQLQDICDRSSL